MSILKTFSTAGLAAAIAVLAPVAAQAATFSYTTNLSGLNEVPANASTATGLVTGSLIGDPDNWEFTYDVDFSGLAAELILAHIHLALAPEGVPPTQQTGPVVHDLDNAPVNVGLTSGSFSGNWTAAEVVAAGVDPTAVYERFLGGQYYFNLHSNTPEFAAPGEIRGQIEFGNDAAAVPEPATGFALLTAAALGLQVSRQRKNGLVEG
jgi:hypothetical protein